MYTEEHMKIASRKEVGKKGKKSLMTVVTACLSLVLKIFETSVDGQSFKINNWNNVWKSGI